MSSVGVLSPFDQVVSLRPNSRGSISNCCVVTI